MPLCGSAFTPHFLLHQPPDAAVEPRSTTSRSSCDALDLLAGQPPQHQLGAQRAALPQRLRHGGEPDVGAASTSSKPITDRSSGTRRPAAWAASSTPIACMSEVAKTAVGRSRPGAARRPPRAPARGRGAAAAIRSGASGTPASASAAAKPSRRRRARVEAEQVLLLVAEEGDLAVAEREQVLGREPAAGDVVDGDRGQRRVRAVDQHDRDARASSRRASVSVGASETVSSAS